MTASVVVIGSSNVDLIMKMPRLPQVGETVTEAEYAQTFGGKGANQAVAAARAGGKVVFINCVGEDTFAPQMLDQFQKDGIETRFIFRETGVACGTALIMVGGNGENYISVAPGANYRLTPAHLERCLEAIETAGVIVLQNEIPPETVYHALDLAERYRRKVLWNFAPARACDPAYLRKASLLVVNEVEVGMLTGRRVETAADALAAANLLLENGVPSVIVTLGAEGALIVRPGFHQQAPAFAVQAVDTTAAGDVYCGCLAVALVEGKPIEQAVRFASAGAAISVTRLGAQPSAPDRSEIEAFLEAQSR